MAKNLEITGPFLIQEGVLEYQVQDGPLSFSNPPVDVTLFMESKRGYCSSCQLDNGRAAAGCSHVRAVKAAYKKSASPTPTS